MYNIYYILLVFTSEKFASYMDENQSIVILGNDKLFTVIK